MFSRRPYPRHNRGRVSGPAVATAFDPASIPGLTSLYIAHPNEAAVVGMLGEDTVGGTLALRATSTSYDPPFSATLVDGGPGIDIQGNGVGTHLFCDNTTGHPELNSGEYTFAIYGEFPDTARNTQMIAGTCRNTGIGSRLEYMGAQGRMRYREHNGTAYILDVLPATSSIDTAVHCIVCTVSRSGGTPHARLYQDGTQVTTASYTGTNGVGNQVNPFSLGTIAGSGTLGDGEIRWVAIWDRALTPTEVTTLSDNANIIASARTVERVCFIGDSITAYPNNYRRQFWIRAKQTTNQIIVPVGDYESADVDFPLSDRHHDGVGGESLATIATRISAMSSRSNIARVIMGGGTNTFPTGTVGDWTTELGNMFDAAIAKFPGVPLYWYAAPYGDGTDSRYTLAGNAGTFNAAAPAVCTAKGVTFIDIHSGANAWVAGTDAADALGHPTASGGLHMGNTIYDAIYP